MPDKGPKQNPPHVTETTGISQPVPPERNSPNEELASMKEEKALLTESLKKALHDSEERTKELNAFFRLGEMTEREGITLIELYRDLANILPASWQYPEITCARITIDDKEYTSSNFKPCAWTQSVPVAVNKVVVGKIEVGYLESKPSEDIGPFLTEEKQIIEGIAERLGKIIERTRLKSEAELQSTRLQSLVNILQHDPTDTQEFLDYALTEAIKLTSSRLGYIYFYNADRKEFVLNTWSKDVLPECRVQKPQTVYQLDKTGIWGEAVRQKAPMVVNDFQASNPLKKGYPEGHVKLKKFMTVPVINGGVIVAVIGLANKEIDYTPADVLQITLMVGSVWNAIERERAKQRAIVSSEEWRDTFDAVTDLVMVLSPEHEFIKVNRATAKTFGMTPEELVGKKCYGIVHGLDRPIEGCPCQESLVTRKPCSQEITDRGRTYIATAAPIFDTDGKLVSLAHTVKDITELKLTEEHEKKAARLDSIGTLAGGIAHDFNNALTGILGNVQLAKLYLEKDNKELVKEVLSEAEQASLMAKTLTQQLLTFARGGTPIKKVLSLNSFIKEAVTFALRGSNVSPEFDIPDALWAVDADQGQLNQVIGNLVINARQAMPMGGTIQVSAKNVGSAARISGLSGGSCVEVTVKDHGTGIPASYFDKIFEPYFTTKGKGSGLGLATSFSIIKNHGGTITFESELGVGTAFYVYLPAVTDTVRQQAVKKAAALPQSQPTKHGKILIMDDEATILMLLNRILGAAGYEVETSKDGAEAINKYSESKKAGKPFDAVILDLTIPGGMGGKETMAKLLEIDPKIKAIVSSGYANDPIMANYKEYGFGDVVVKPYSIDNMESALNALLATT
jgi:PAS domain S-box-containing protein